MISSQDFERLSAYLDNQLSSKEKAALEARLAREPELKATLDELRQTVRALRTLPVVRPPRNFTLSARQLGAAPQRRFFPVLRLATSLAALAMVLAFAGDFALSRTLATAPVQYTTAQRNAAQPAATAQEAAGTLALPAAALPVGTPQPEATTLAAQSAPAAAAPPQVMDQGPAGAGATGSATATPVPEAETPMAAAVLAASPITTTGTAPPLVAKSAAATAPAPGTATPAAPNGARAALAPTEAPPTPAATAIEAPVLAEAYPPPTSEGTAVPAPAAPAPGLPWRALEISLIGLTLLLGIITWLLRRR